MPPPTPLVDRVRAALTRQGHAFQERRMFGGICFLLDGHMACGVVDEELVVRVELEATGDALRQPATRPMRSEGEVMRGFLYVQPEGLASQRDLQRWLDQGIARARSMPTRKKKATARKANAPKAKTTSKAMSKATSRTATSKATSRTAPRKATKKRPAAEGTAKKTGGKRSSTKKPSPKGSARSATRKRRGP